MKTNEQPYSVFKILPNKEQEEIKGRDFATPDEARKWVQTYGELSTSYALKKKGQ